jgi:hypothetical protein
MDCYYMVYFHFMGLFLLQITQNYQPQSLSEQIMSYLYYLSHVFDFSLLSLKIEYLLRAELVRAFCFFELILSVLKIFLVLFLRLKNRDSWSFSIFTAEKVSISI